jgi:GTP-binding protein
MIDAAAADVEAAWIEPGRKLFAGPCDFYFAAAKSDGLPPIERPEIAFAGRSNVGKSSLINALTGRTSLARTSNTPGRTQELIFFMDTRRSPRTNRPHGARSRAITSAAARR